MNLGLSNVLKGLPALAGVIFGIRIYTGGILPAVICIVMFAIAAACAMGGRGIMHRSPRIGRWLIEIWILAAVAVVAVATIAVIGLSVMPLPKFLGTHPDVEVNKAAASLFVGAFTAYLALIWTKDIGDATGFFWPSTQFKGAMTRAHKKLQNPPPGGSTLSEAMFEDVVTGYGRLGWDFKARGIRAGLLAASL